MKVHVASGNPKKVELVKQLFSYYFPNHAIEVTHSVVDSGVPNTPWDAQTKSGAINRAMNALTTIPGCDYYIGIETGLTTRGIDLCEETWCALVSSDGNRFFGYGSGNIISKQTKSRVLENKTTNTKTLEVWNALIHAWELYSGSPEQREMGLKSAIETCLIQLQSHHP